MLNEKKKLLIDEADKQVKVLKNLKKWLRNFMGFSTIGLVIACWGIQGTTLQFAFGIIGIIINMGIKNGEKNVKKILKIVGQL